MATDINSQNATKPKNNSTYTTRKFTRVVNGRTYNWTVTANKPSKEAIDNLCKLILKIF